MNTMQSPFEFLKWIPISGEKHVGIVVIRFERRFIFRFKILPSEQGGYWAVTASLKTGVFNGKDKYDNAFDLDSSYENDAMRQFVIQCAEQHLNRQVQQNASVFQPQGNAQQNPNFGQQAQQPNFAPTPQYQQQAFDDSGCPF